MRRYLKKILQILPIESQRYLQSHTGWLRGHCPLYRYIAISNYVTTNVSFSFIIALGPSLHQLLFI